MHANGTTRQLKVLYLAAEAYPLIKVGGLGDVAGSLPRAVRAVAHQGTEPPIDIDIRLVLPFHGGIQRHGRSLRRLVSFSLALPGGSLPVKAWETRLDEVPVYLLSGAPISQEAPVYSDGAGVDSYKYTYFSLAALELSRALAWTPDVVHANDWHTALALYAMRREEAPTFACSAGLLGVHNLPYMGDGSGAALRAFGLPPADDERLPRWARSTPLPLGLLAADHIVTVSPQYAREILTPEYGAGLDGFLARRKDSIHGILNGIDTRQWDPASDTALAANYTAETLERRAANKATLLDEFGLQEGERLPLLAVVSRLEAQKGIDLLPPALEALAGEAWQLIILGSGSRELEEAMRQFAGRFPERARAALRFDSGLSRRLYAGADMLLLPSRYEPCGLSQMIAMRYGCLPVARAVGGLRDTIHDAPGSTGTGFLFAEATPQDFASAIRRALDVYQDAALWERMQRNAMAQDFSWERSAKEYIHLYLHASKEAKQKRRRSP